MANNRLSVLKRRSEFLYILKNGQRVRPTDWLVLNFTFNTDGIMRCGWTLPRQVGPAVIRNKLKRWSRVYFREVMESGNWAPVDVNVVFRRAENDFYKKMNYEKFSQVLDRGWKQLRRRAQENSSSAHRDV